MKYKIITALSIMLLCSCGTLPLISEKDTPATYGCMDYLFTPPLCYARNSKWLKNINALITTWNDRTIKKQRAEDGYYLTFVEDTVLQMHKDAGDPDAVSMLRGGAIKFKLYVNTISNVVTVTIFVYTNISSTWTEKWQKEVHEKWSNRVNIVDYSGSKPKIYDVRVVLEIVTRENEKDAEVDILRMYEIRACNDCRSDIVNWNIYRTGAAAHEVGHILGNKDEYGVVDGVDYNGKNWNTRNIMAYNNGVPTLQNYNYILEQVKKLTENDNLELRRKKPFFK